MIPEVDLWNVLKLCAATFMLAVTVGFIALVGIAVYRALKEEG